MPRMMFEAAEDVAAIVVRRDRKGRRLIVLAGLLVATSVHRVTGQAGSVALSPSEAYKAALAPFTATRSQANDLTDADKFALGIGIAQASRDCLALSSDISKFAGNGKELFALGQLCIFGQQYEPARAAIINNLALPQPEEREQTLLLLVRAYLGLKEPNGAEAQVDSLLRDYPYDAAIHGAIDQVIDSAEGVDRNDLALKLCATQNATTLPLLEGGKALEGKNGSVSAAKLFADAVRCVAVAQSSGKPGNLDQLAAIAQQPGWAGTADLAVMQAALERQQMVGKSVPLASLHGYLLGTGGLIPKTVLLRRGVVVLVPFTLWAPSTPHVASDLAKFMPQRQTINYAITSWHANTGREDVRSSEVLEGLRAWQRSLPNNVSILIVPDSVLSEFHSDVFPAGILVRNGTVLANGVISSEGAERLLVNAFAEDMGAH